MYMLIEPLDVLFFRDSRPFGAGDNHTGQGGQMPAAQPFAGAVRSAVLAEILASRGQSFQAFRSDEKLAAAKEIGTPDSYGDFSLRGPFAAQQDNGAVSLQLPLPLDLLREKDEQESVTVRGMLPLMGMLDKVHRSRRETAPLWLRQEVPPGQLSDQIVLDKQLGQYLKNDNGRPQMHADSGFTTTEKRVGIALTSDRNAEPGHLYATEFLRLKEQSGLRRGFVVQTNVVSLPEQGLLKLGGEGRAAHYTCLPESEPQDWLSLLNFEVLNYGGFQVLPWARQGGVLLSTHLPALGCMQFIVARKRTIPLTLNLMKQSKSKTPIRQTVGATRQYRKP